MCLSVSSVKAMHASFSTYSSKVTSIDFLVNMCFLHIKHINFCCIGSFSIDQLNLYQSIRPFRLAARCKCCCVVSLAYADPETSFGTLRDCRFICSALVRAASKICFG